MKKEVAEVWVKALRSGEYKQAQKVLHSEDGGMCCLGVLCDLYAKNVLKAPDGYAVSWEKSLDAHEPPSFLVVVAGPEDCRDRETEGGILPSAIRDWTEMITKNGSAPCFDSPLSEMNDRGRSFEDIANIIEVHYRDL